MRMSACVYVCVGERVQGVEREREYKEQRETDKVGREGRERESGRRTEFLLCMYMSNCVDNAYLYMNGLVEMSMKNWRHTWMLQPKRHI